jgi:hypothetical protein
MLPLPLIDTHTHTHTNTHTPWQTQTDMGASWIPNRFQAALFTRPKAIESTVVLLFKVTIQNWIELNWQTHTPHTHADTFVLIMLTVSFFVDFVILLTWLTLSTLLCWFRLFWHYSSDFLLLTANIDLNLLILLTLLTLLNCWLVLLTQFIHDI